MFSFPEKKKEDLYPASRGQELFQKLLNRRIGKTKLEWLDPKVPTKPKKVLPSMRSLDDEWQS